MLPLPAAPSGFQVRPIYFRPTEGTKVRIRLAPARSQQRTLWLPARRTRVGPRGVISGVPTASLGAPVCCHEVNVLPFWLSVQPTGRDGDLLACKDIGIENYRMLSLTLIFRNFHWRHGERIYRRKSPQLSIEAIARYRDQQFESGLLQR